MQGILIRRCELCKLTFNAERVPDIEKALDYLRTDGRIPVLFADSTILTTELHHCGNGRMGLAVAIGATVKGTEQFAAQ